jgi:predicted nucleotidyltransferase
MKIQGPGESSLLLLNIIKHLEECRIPYVIVGAFAASFYGVVRASLDADAVISVNGDENKLNDLLAPLKKSGLKVAVRRGDLRDPIRCVVNIEDKFQNRVDLLMGIRGMNKDVFKRAVTTSFMNTQIKIIGIEDFVAMKIFAGSAKDLEDARGVLKISARKINKTLLKQLTLAYGKKELEQLEKISKK